MSGLPSRTLTGALLCLAMSLVSFGHAGYVSAKAVLAQVLIERSWRASAHGGEHPPWPWADSWPVAKLTMKTGEFFVLSGAHGTSLAFGPGHVSGTSAPGQPGTMMIAGHRDTHFTGLDRLLPGQVVTLENHRGTYNYEIDHSRIVDVRDEPLLYFDGSGIPALALVTCYPLDAATRGPLRLVVMGHLIGE